jgi:TldD protein
VPATEPPALTARDAAIAADLRARFAFLPEIVAEMERSVPYAAVLVRSTVGQGIDLRDGDQTARRLDPQSGIVITASNGHALEEAATDATEPEPVRALARALVERVRAARPPEGQEPLDIAMNGGLDADFATPVEVDPASVTLADKLARYEALRLQLRGLAKHAVQAIATYGDSEQRSVFVNRGGMVTQQLRRVRLSLVLIVADGQEQRYDFTARGATGGLEHLVVTDAALAELAETTEALLTAKPVPAGTYDVVCDPDVSGIVAHEAFGHGVETDMFLKDRARAAEYVGKRVGSDLVNVVDDPTWPAAYGTYFIDDEGVRATPTQIISDGIFQRGITDLYSATRLGIPRSANGRRESVQRKAYARMSNTFFTAGTSTREELLSSLDNGLFLCGALNGMEDPKGWGIQIWANYAREYRGGRPTGVIYSPIAMTGYLPELLADISMVSNEFELIPATCGKGWKELVPVSSGGPHLRTRCRLG